MPDKHEDRVYYNDHWMVRGWPARIQAAQRMPTYEIAGTQYPRIRYGRERRGSGAPSQTCHDCGVLPNHFHVPGCDMERCPRCGGQAFLCSCPCPVEDDEGPP